VTVHRILTIEREFGCGGAAIAAAAARRLGWTLWDQNLTQEIARLAHVSPAAAERHDERRDPLLYRLAKVFARRSYERSISIQDKEVFDAERMVKLLTQVIRRVAESGDCVIVGRGASCILRERRDAFHVFVYAPYEERMCRIVAQGKQVSEARELLDTVDKERAAFIKQYLGPDWPTLSHFDLWVNSAMGDETAVETILGAMKACEGISPAGRAT
jgi:cytidylate kinase